MSNYDEMRDNSGSMFPNDRKTQQNHPDYKGSIMVAGVDYWISSWIKTGRNGDFQSIALTPKEDRGAPVKTASRPVILKPTPIQSASEQSTGKNSDIDDDLPF